MTQGHICVEFKKCGIYPFDPQAIIIDVQLAQMMLS